jgi:hypothetical protein
MRNGIPAALLPLLDVWKVPQVELALALRWKKYAREAPGIRAQNSLEHTVGIIILGGIVMEQIDPTRFLDRELVIAALALHDVPEYRGGGDVHYIDKTAKKDLREYIALRGIYEPMGPPVFPMFHRAYLLQFALRDPPEFPNDAHAIMESIARNFSHEALTFDVIERWDYVLYALEQYHERGNGKILTQVLRNQVSHLDDLAKKLHGFGDAIWTPELSSWAHGFLKEHEGLWLEKKGES